MFLPASFPSWHLLIRTSFNTASTGLCASLSQDLPPTIQTSIALLTSPSEMQSSYIKHFPKPTPWSQTLPSSASLTLEMAQANSRNILRSLWIKRLLVGCVKAHPASTQEVTEERFSMVPSASPSVVNSSPSTSLIPARMFVPQPKNSPALMALRSWHIHV